MIETTIDRKSFFEGGLNPVGYGVHYLLVISGELIIKVKFFIQNFTQCCIYPLHNTKQNEGGFHGEEIFYLENFSHQGQGSKFQCDQYTNTPSEGFCSSCITSILRGG